MRIFASGLTFAMLVAVTLAVTCTVNSNCRGGTCINGNCAPLSGTGGPCDEASDCLYGNTCNAAKKCAVPCPGQVNCGTPAAPTCKTVSSDNQNCGACGNVCPNGKSCVGGQCLCDPGTLNCGNTCTNPNTDAYNCGFCGNKCGQNGFCSGGACSCYNYYGNCINDYNFDGCETTLTYNDNNCASCGNKCGQRAFCNYLTCQCTNSAYGNCNNDYNSDGCEVVFATDDTYCGSCGTGKNCGGTLGTTDSTCSGGSCVCSNPDYNNCDGLYSANGCETNIKTDDTYCGGCGTGKNCGGSAATDSYCNSGSCACYNTNYRNCYNGYSDGCETDITNSDANCGACYNGCGGSGNTDSVCSSGSCACYNSNYRNCNNNYASDGCETDITNSDANCGSCGTYCGGFGQYDSYCSGGSCRCSFGGYANCNTNYASDGCEIYLPADANNCGSCGYNCGANAQCSNGQCQCVGAYANCNNNYNSDGCEVYLNSNANCGGCGKTCGTNGECFFGSCQCSNAAYGNCNNDYASDGCETTFATDDTYCGSCGPNKNCGGSGVTDSYCTGGSCACYNTNYRNCYNGYTDGCETDIRVSDANCGACGTYCGGFGATDSTCSNSQCGCTSSDYGNCDGSFVNGCETNLQSDDTYCGSCGPLKNCGGSGGTNSYCNGGSCACNNPGYANCNSNYASDGCESYLPTDANNCGACGTACNSNAYCAFSYCFCNTNYGDCDDDIANGCEVDLRTNSNYCGYCTTKCDPGFTCVNSVCSNVSG